MARRSSGRDQPTRLGRSCSFVLPSHFQRMAFGPDTQPSWPPKLLKIDGLRVVFSSLELQSRTTQWGFKKKLREAGALFPAVACNLGIDLVHGHLVETLALRVLLQSLEGRQRRD